MRYLTIPGILRLSLKGGWVSTTQAAGGYFLVIALTILVTLGYWQFELQALQGPGACGGAGKSGERSNSWPMRQKRASSSI
ncbi:MAG: hypothetical protein ACLR2E_18365 [Lachnospiraceae bacterium]